MNNTGGGTEAATRFEFSGTGGEYFRIWIVNLALTIVTLGIYSAWAKVRRLQYFYRSTSLLGGSFDYHGNPRAILKGRLIGAGLFVAYNAAGKFNPILGLVALALLLVVLPWMLRQSFGFRLHNSSYRGLRFRFAGTTRDAYKAFLGWPLLGYLTLGFLFPLVHQRIKAYQHGNSVFGQTRFEFSARPKSFFMLYLKAAGLFVPIVILVGAAVFMMLMVVASNMDAMFNTKDPAQGRRMVFAITAGMILIYVAVFLIIAPWFAARLQNLLWNQTRLGSHAFMSDASAGDLFEIYVTNFIGIICTLGLYKPFADIRLARYRFAHLGVTVRTDLSEIERAEQQTQSAVGEETADLFDVDLSF